MDLRVNDRPGGIEKIFQRSLRAAKVVMRRRTRLLLMVQRAYTRTARHGSALGQLRHDLTTLLRLIRAWAMGRYRNVPWKSVLYAVAAVIYFLNPVDLIPDKLLAIGFVDDAAVIAAVVRMIQKDLQAFERWESGDEEVEDLIPARAA